jgi:hypothetical protein
MYGKIPKAKVDNKVGESPESNPGYPKRNIAPFSVPS